MPCDLNEIADSLARIDPRLTPLIVPSGRQVSFGPGPRVRFGWVTCRGGRGTECRVRYDLRASILPDERGLGLEPLLDEAGDPKLYRGQQHWMSDALDWEATRDEFAKLVRWLIANDPTWRVRFEPPPRRPRVPRGRAPRYENQAVAVDEPSEPPRYASLDEALDAILPASLRWMIDHVVQRTASGKPWIESFSPRQRAFEAEKIRAGLLPEILRLHTFICLHQFQSDERTAQIVERLLEDHEWSEKVTSLAYIQSRYDAFGGGDYSVEACIPDRRDRKNAETFACAHESPQCPAREWQARIRRTANVSALPLRVFERWRSRNLLEAAQRETLAALWPRLRGNSARAKLRALFRVKQAGSGVFGWFASCLLPGIMDPDFEVAGLPANLDLEDGLWLTKVEETHNLAFVRRLGEGVGQTLDPTSLWKRMAEWLRQRRESPEGAALPEILWPRPLNFGVFRFFNLKQRLDDVTERGGRDCWTRPPEGVTNACAYGPDLEFVCPLRRAKLCQRFAD